ncbi:MAG: hypothetical protein ACI3X2_11245 [Butyricicoccus porcorum]
MSNNIIRLNEDLIKHDLKDLVRSSVEEALNTLLEKEAAREKAHQVVEKLREMKLSSAAKKLQDGIEETLTVISHRRRNRPGGVDEDRHRRYSI